MNYKTHYLKFIYIFLLGLFLGGQGVYAQSPITATVDRTSLSTDEVLILKVTVTSTDVNPPAPAIPPLEGFNVVGTSSSSQVSIVNNNITAQAIYTYRLQPTEAGDLTINPISVSLGGQTYSTDPISIQVSQGSTPTEPKTGESASAPTTLNGQDFFIDAIVDDPTPYLGQQLIYTFRFYQAVRLFGSPSYDAPAFTGFWHKQQSDQTQQFIEAAGRTYQVTELRTLLFPTVAGETTINPASLTMPGGAKTQTQPIIVDVQPLPPGAPDDFTGAVGQFTLSAEIDASEGIVNDPITIIITLSGQGNIENLPDPIWPEINQWRSFESKATINTQVQNGRLSGSKVYERLMVPGAPGQFTIPAITYSYFDPVSEDYKTTSTEPFPITIAPAEAETPIPFVGESNKETVERLASDVRHIKPVPPLLETAPTPLTARTSYWLAWFLPLLIIGLNFAWQRKQTFLQQNVGLARSLQAHKRAIKALAEARKEGQDPYAAAGQILTNYLSDKFNQPIGGLTETELIAILQSKSLDSSLIKRIQTCLAESDMGRFAPAASTPNHDKRLLSEVEKLIGDLEKQKLEIGD